MNGTQSHRYSRLEMTDMSLDQPVSRSGDGRDLKTTETQTETLLTPGHSSTATTAIIYKTYKRRFFGLVELILLNLVVSWGVWLRC